MASCLNRAIEAKEKNIMQCFVQELDSFLIIYAYLNAKLGRYGYQLML